MAIHLKKYDRFFKAIVWTSTALYLAELSTGSAHSRAAHPFFLWAERAIAGLLTVEVGIRVRNRGWRYLATVFGVIDLVAILPFWGGFAVPVAWLPVVRTLRVLRLLKYFRYSRSLQLTALAFYRAAPQLKALLFSLFVVAIFSTVGMYELEHHQQPDKFDGLFDSVWYTAVTVATIGYGDMTPVTRPGKVLAMLLFLPSLAIFGGIIGVIGNSFASVFADAVDPTVDPLELFRKEQGRHRALRIAERNYRNTP